MESSNGRRPEPDYRCRRCGLPGARETDGHLDEQECITALLRALRTRDLQLERATRMRLRPPVKAG